MSLLFGKLQIWLIGGLILLLAFAGLLVNLLRWKSRAEKAETTAKTAKEERRVSNAINEARIALGEKQKERRRQLEDRKAEQARDFFGDWK
jgi:Ca2+/Na+ antiporter